MQSCRPGIENADSKEENKQVDFKTSWGWLLKRGTSIAETWTNNQQTKSDFLHLREVMNSQFYKKWNVSTQVPYVPFSWKISSMLSGAFVLFVFSDFLNIFLKRYILVNNPMKLF